MSGQRIFWTGLITIGEEPLQPKPPFAGAGWTATLAPQRRDPPAVHKGKEIVLYARSWVSAQRALDLIYGCHQLVFDTPPIISVHPIAYNETEPDWMQEDDRRRQVEMTLSTSDFPLACAIAAKASRRRRWVYAVAKLKFSQSLYSVHHVDLEPWKSPNLPISSFPDDHVLFSYAIISAYSVLEDIGLELRASTRRPSRISGNWNPIVKEDLDLRLAKAGVDLGETLLWTIRGPKRTIERRRPIPPARKAAWSGWFVRDSKLSVADAIAYADWLRDRVASHAAKDLTRVLSPYDVVNVQHLARRLLLECLGFWRWHEKRRIRIANSKAKDCPEDGPI